MISTKEEFITTLLAQGVQKFSIYFINRDIENNEEIRETIIELENPQIAFWYAWIFKVISDDIKKICCKHHVAAMLYARDVAGVPCKETRTAACQHPTLAVMYAKGVDRCPTEETRKAASKVLETREEYEKWAKCF